MNKRQAKRLVEGTVHRLADKFGNELSPAEILYLSTSRHFALYVQDARMSAVDSGGDEWQVSAHGLEWAYVGTYTRQHTPATTRARLVMNGLRALLPAMDAADLLRALVEGGYIKDVTAAQAALFTARRLEDAVSLE